MNPLIQIQLISSFFAAKSEDWRLCCVWAMRVASGGSDPTSQWGSQWRPGPALGTENSLLCLLTATQHWPGQLQSTLVITELLAPQLLINWHAHTDNSYVQWWFRELRRECHFWTSVKMWSIQFVWASTWLGAGLTCYFSVININLL